MIQVIQEEQEVVLQVDGDDQVEGDDLMDAKHTTNQTCPVCGETVAPERLARYPSAVVCGRRTCSKQYRRTASNRLRGRYRARRLARDPAFRLRERQLARVRYVKSRLRLGKTPAAREPLEAENSYLATLLQRAARAVRSICG